MDHKGGHSLFPAGICEVHGPSRTAEQEEEHRILGSGEKVQSFGDLGNSGFDSCLSCSLQSTFTGIILILEGLVPLYRIGKQLAYSRSHSGVWQS